MTGDCPRITGEAVDPGLSPHPKIDAEV